MLMILSWTQKLVKQQDFAVFKKAGITPNDFERVLKLMDK
jgi:hypothetical protein